MSRLQPWRAHAVALAAYCLVTLLFFAGVLPHLATALPGGPVAAVDGWQNVWHLWWVQHALSQPINPLQTPLLFYPHGVNLALHPLNLAAGVLMLPVTALAGPVVAYNVAVLLAFILAGFGAYLLGLRVGVPPVAAWVAGFLFTFSPFHVTKAYDGQLEMISLQWLACYAWLLVTTTRLAAWRWPVFAAVALALVGYTSLYYLLYSALLSLLVALLWAPWRSVASLRSYLLRLLVVPTVAVLALTPLLLKLGASLGEVRGGDGGPGTVDDLLLARSANLLDFWLPSSLHPLWGPSVAHLGPLLHPNVSAWNSALGYTTLVLALIGFLTAWSHTWRWFVIALLGLTLALGPELQVGTLHTGIPLPYTLVMYVPGMDTANRPSHFVLLALIALVPSVGMGLQWLIARYQRRVVVVTLLIATLELVTPPWPLHTASVNPLYRQLAATPGALMVLPIDIDSSAVLVDQTVHQRPLVGGFLARTPPYPFVNTTPALQQLWQLTPDAHTYPVGATFAELLDAFDVRDVVVHWDRIPSAQSARAQAALDQVFPNVTPLRQGDTAIYHVPMGTRLPFVYVGTGWYPEEQAADRRWRWMQSAGVLQLMNPRTTSAILVLQLQAESYAEPRLVTLTLNDQRLTTWRVSAQPVSSTLTLRLLLPPGLSRLDLVAPSTLDPAGRGPISIVLSGLKVVLP